MKRMLSAILVLTLLLTLLPQATLFASAEVYSGNCGAEGDNLKWSFSRSTGTLTITGSGNMKNFIDHADRPWSNFCSDILSVELSNELRTIGDYAFAWCYNMTHFAIPNSVTSIGKNAFEYCSGLSYVVLPDNLTSIGKEAFRNCSAMTIVNIPSNIMSIGYGAYAECSSLKEIKVDENNSAYCALSGILYNKACTELLCCPAGYYSTCEIPASVHSIRDYAFEGCAYVRELSLAEGVTDIGFRTFHDCALASIKLPNSLMIIGEEAFIGCDSLTSIVIPCNVSSIGNGAFMWADNLVRIDVDENNQQYCSKDGVLFNKAMTKLLSFPNGREGAYEIPNGVITIEKEAFDGCYNVTEIIIPNSVTAICESAFSGCWGLTAITIPDSVISIGDFAFSHCEEVEKISFGKNLKVIGSCAFENIESLTNVTIPGNVEKIGYEAFVLCTNLTDLTLESGVKAIGEWAFWNCNSLKNITFENGLDIIGECAFRECDSLENIIIPESVRKIDGGAFNCANLVSVTVLSKNCDIYTSWNWDTLGKPNLSVIYGYVGSTAEKYASLMGHTFVKLPSDNPCEDGHSWSAWIQTVVPTCTENGEESRTCTRCGAVETREVAATGHKSGAPLKENSIVATCTEKGGYDTVVYCAVCQTELSREHTDIPALGHSWNEGVVTVEATEEAEGEMTFTCTRCGETKTEVIPKNDHEHDYQAVVTAPTCTEQGYTTYTCSKCGASYVADYVPATGHNFVDGMCTVCGAADPDYKPDDLQPPVTENPFVDVAETAYYFEPVMWAVDNGVTGGIDETHFGPNKPCTRAQVVMFLYSAAGKPSLVGDGAHDVPQNPFVDVKATAYYHDAVLWAFGKGITGGVDATHFGPNKTCTRAQVVTFLYSWKGKPAYTATENPFDDVKTTAYYYDAVMWAVENGVTGGTGPRTFGPNKNCTRCQVVTFLYKAK